MKRSTAIHIGSLVSTKTADGLIDPKLVLAWLLNAIGSPGILIGLLVPVREAGALLPQLLIARRVEREAVRKYFWVAGSALQGFAALGIAASALFLPGAVAGWVILGCLTVLAVARSACSVSYKDVLSRTVERGQRGRVSGAAGTVSAIAVFGFAILLATGVVPREPRYVASAIAVAGILWLGAAVLFSTLEESEDKADADPAGSLPELVRPLMDDAELRTYIATRALLISTALAPPFLVMLGSNRSAEFGNLGLLLISSSIAAIVSSYLWGALSDRSSRITLMLAGALSAMSFATAAVSGFFSEGSVGGAVVAGFVFVAQVSYEGARAGRKTHLTDMDAQGRKAVYTALSNSLIGLLLLIGGVLGLLADSAGPETVLAVLALMSVASVFAGARLSEVQRDTR